MEDAFCNSPLWDLNVIWNTDDPNFTPCFQATVLSWTPCLFLWFFAPFSVRSLIKRKTWTVPWSWLNTTKFLLTIALIFLSLVDLSYSLILYFGGGPTYPTDFITPILKATTFALAAGLLILNKIRGVPSSALLFLFWFCLVVFGAPQYKFELDRAYHKELSASVLPFVSYMIYYAIVLCLLFLNFFADLLPASPSYFPEKKVSPYARASFPSLVLFSWFDPLAWKGFQRPIVPEDLWALAERDSVRGISSKFDKYCKKSSRKQPCPTNGASIPPRTGNGMELKSSAQKPGANEVYPSIWIPIVKTFWSPVLFAFSMKLGNDILIFVSPQLLKWLISFMSADEQIWHGYFYAAGLLVAASFQTLFLAHYFNDMRVVGLRIRVALTSAVYRKAMNISSAARKESTVGEIMNLMSVDVHRFLELMPHLCLMWSAPLQITLAIYFLYDILGVSVLAGLVVMILVILINIPIARMSDALNMKQMRYKDERIKLMNEILSGIKVLKLYAWETSFEKHIQKIREKEVKTLKQLAFLNSMTAFIWSCSPLMVALTTFGVYLFIDEEHHLDAEKTFSTVALFNVLKFPLVMLPTMISNLVQTSVSVRRIDKFMNCEELDPDCVTHDASEKDPLVIEKGNFGWGGAVALHDINMKVSDKSLVAIVGSVGCGKSSLLSAFLGEMELVSGRVNTKGNIAYVTQQAWIQNATLRDNILFGKEFDLRTYNRVITACALRNDFALLPGGDETEIGEKGINLSGGQKQRISLARAVYSDADVYFLDDPLSAVDSHVGKHIFENVIGPQGLLKNKTRVLVTHGLTYLPEVDEIYVLKGGRISEHGTYKQLIDKKGAFAEFILTHLQESESDDKPAEGSSEERPASPPAFRRTREKSGTASPAPMRRRSMSTSERGSMCSLRQFSHEDELTFDNEDDDDRRNKIIEEEVVMTGNIKWSVFSYYMQAMGWFFVFGALGSTFMFQAFGVGSNLWLSIWTSRDTTDSNGAQDPAERNWFLEVYALLGLCAGLCAIVADMSPRIGCVRASRALHDFLLHSVFRAPLTFTDTTPTGRILSRFSKDLDILDNKLPIEIGDTLYCVMEVIGVLFIITYATPVFLYCIPPLAIAYYILQRFYTATSRQLQRLESISRSPLFSHFGETVAGAQVIRAYGAVNRFVLEYEKRMDYNQVCFHPAVISIRWLSTRLETIGNLIIFFAAFLAVLERGTLSAGLVGLSVTYALQVTGALNWFVRMASSVETNVVAVERIKEYTEIEKEAKWDVPATAPPENWPAKGIIVFENFKIRYRPGLDLVLKGLNFSVNEGEKIGIVGRTGAGKSSLTLALFRIIEAAEGVIYIDGIDISKLGLHTLRSKLTVIPQDPILFSGSLRMNLDPLGIYPDAKIWHALELSHLKEFVKSQPAGLQHEISEGGENLSVGQRQLICLARALLRKTKVLILDEATAAVDVETDDLIQSTIRSEFKDCTVLTIAHRLNTIMDSDRVLVLDHGLIMEYDSPLNLLRNPKSLFYSLVKDAALDVETILQTQSINGRPLVVKS